MRHAWAALLLAILVLPSAAAHAVLESGTPAPNGHADPGLTTIELVFTEDLEQEYTRADVIDLNGTSWAAGPVQFDEGRRNVLRLPIQELASGIYAVNWQALSVDSHTTRGSYIFSAGDAELRFTLDTPAHDHAEHTPGQILREGAARAAFYGGLFLVVGMPLFALVVARDAPSPRALRTAAAFGLVGALAGAVSLWLFAQRTELGLLVALGTSAGGLLGWRAGLLLAATAALVVAAARPARARPAGWLAVALGVGAALATSLGSHAAASREMTSLLVAADLAHLLVAAAWIGGVVALLHLVAERGASQLAPMVVRFSPIAIASVVVLLATGAAASVAHVPCLRGEACAGPLWEEPYLRLVLIKAGLLVPLVALGAFNKLRVGPALERGAPPRALRRALQAEAMIMVLILAAAGILASTPPPDGVVESAEAPAPLVLQQTSPYAHVILQVRPNPVVVGIQDVRVNVHPTSGQIANSTTVQLKVWGPGDPEPEIGFGIERVAPDEWATRQGLFTRAGTWDVMVLVQLEELVKLKFQVEVANPS